MISYADLYAVYDLNLETILCALAFFVLCIAMCLKELNPVAINVPLKVLRTVFRLSLELVSCES